jgi:tetratricopeptide (TPR) repeat protein
MAASTSTIGFPSGSSPPRDRTRCNLSAELHDEESAWAERAASRAIGADASYAPAHVNRGISLSLLGRAEDAKAELEEAVRLDSHNAYAHVNLASILLDKSPADALSHATRSTELNPRLGGAHSIRGSALLALGSATDAIQAFNSAVSLEPDTAGHYYDLSRAHATTGNHVEALDALRRAFTDDSTAIKRAFSDAASAELLESEHYGSILRQMDSAQGTPDTR